MGESVGIIGFGEAGQAFAGADGWRGAATVYDRLTDSGGSRDAKEADYRRIGVAGAASLSDAVSGAPVVLSLVTADQSGAVARGVAAELSEDALFLDMNSVAPGTKRASAETIARGRGRYVDVAIMAPVLPGRLDVPLLVSGPPAPAALAALSALGFRNVRAVGSEVGQASAIKMIRSVIVKGIEALTAEAMLAAEAAGVTSEVLASLDASEKADPWSKRADYNLDRMMAHGLRRAEEMAEVAKTLEGLGIEPLMTSGTVRRQREIGSLRIDDRVDGIHAKVARIGQGARP